MVIIHPAPAGKRWEKEGKMKFYCVVQEYYDNGRVSAWITNHVSVDGTMPENRYEEHANKDVYLDYFKDKDKAIKFCDDAKRA